MWRDQRGVMRGSPALLSCILMVGWSTVSSQIISPRVSSLLIKDFKDTSPLSKEQLSDIVGNPNSSRKKRATECPPDKKVTEEVIKNVTMPMDYTPEVVRACLKGSVLVDNLGILTTYAFTSDQQVEMKANLDEIFPDGYPESVIRNLGDIVNIVNLDDVQKWKFTSPETLASLMKNMIDDKLKRAIIEQYINSGGALNSEALNAIGSEICLLNKEELNQITDATLKEVKSLYLTECNQSTKDILYSKATRAFSDQKNNFPPYYDLIKPYLGGAPVEDLRDLSGRNVNMDIQTFMKLKKDSLMGLNTNEVKGLLGKNLKKLANEQTKSPVKDWIRRQMQSDLNNLGIGKIRGGIPEGYINIMPRQ